MGEASGAKICVVFEGRDTAGKGGTIQRIMERVSPACLQHIALAAPTDREKSQMYIQRYVPHLPAAGEVVIFDRSWYNRAGVERVMGFCTPAEPDKLPRAAPRRREGDGRVRDLLLKYWLEVGPDEQTRRLKSRIDDPPQDLEALPHGPEVVRPLVRLLAARDAMFEATDTAWAPWFVADNEVKKRGRLNIIHHLLSQVPYEPLPTEDMKLPKRQSAGGYVEPSLPLKRIPTPF